MIIPPHIKLIAAVAGAAGLFSAGLYFGHEWRDRACDEAVAKAEAAAAKRAAEIAKSDVETVTEYVEVEKIVYRDRDVIRDRIVRMCDNVPSGTVTEGADQAPAESGGDEELGQLAAEIPQCVSLANQMNALLDALENRGMVE